MKTYVKTVFLLLGFSQLIAQPSGFKLVQGEATPPHLENCGQLISSGNAIIEWDDFSIGEQERFEFSQGSVADTVLNRVTGSLRSEILGELHSNGKLILVNPQGVFIGPNGRVDTAGLIASSLDLSDEYFMSQNEFLFDGESMGEVINLGTIEAGGEVFLLGPNVRNDGVIRGEDVGLGVGRSILVRPEESQRILIQIPIDEGELSHSGHIQGSKVELKSGAFAKAIQCSGVIDANLFEERGGEIYLVADQGICEVSGRLEARGGTIHVLGDTVHLLNGTEIDVSGVEGGGEVLVGGDYQGKNQDVKNAKYVWAGNETVVKADAIEKGDGGRVIFWADEVMSHFGKISIRGGEMGGDGGFAEVSGKSLDYRGFTDGGAPLGRSGTLLLDPNDIVIGASATTGSFTACVPPVSYTITSGTATNQILNTDLQTQLASCSVTISTVGSAGSGPNSGSITVSSGVSWSAATVLTLQAASFISVSAAITCTSASTSSGITLTSNGTGAGTNPGILLSAGGVLTCNAGPVSLSGTSDGGSGSPHGISLNGGSITTTAGSITLTGTSGPSTAAAYGINFATVNGITSTSGPITLSGTSNSSSNSSYGILLGSSWTTGTSGLLTFSNCIGGTSGGAGVGYGIVFNAALSTGGSITATNNIRTRSTSSFGGPGGVYIAGNITSTGGGNISITASAASVNSTSGSSAVAGIAQTAAMSTNGNGNVTLIGTGGSAGTTSVGIWHIGTITTVNGSIQIAGTVSGGGSVVSNGIDFDIATNPLTSTTGSITVSGSNTSSSANAHGIATNRSWTTGTSGTVTFGASVTDGSVTISGCAGGSGSTSHGLKMGAAFSTSGDVVATNLIQGGTGSGSIGFTTGSNFATTGASKNITITASSQATAGAAHGISLTGGTLSASSGTITLSGTAGTSVTASYGINIGAAVTGSQGITLNGTPGGNASSYAVALGGTLTTSGNAIAINGITLYTTGATLDSTNGGVSSAGAAITFNNTISGAQTPVFRAGTSGVITLPKDVGASGTRLTGITFTSGGGLTLGNNSTSSTVYLNGVAFAPGMPVTLAGTETIDTNGGSINFSSTIGGSAQTLTLTANAGTITFGGDVGTTGARLTALTLTSNVGNAISLGGTLYVANGVTFTNANPLTLTAAAGIVTTNSAITIPATVNGAASFTLNAGSGAITLSGAIGGTTRPTALTITTTNTTANQGFLINNATINLAGPFNATGATLTTIGTDTTVDTSNGGVSNGLIEFAGIKSVTSAAKSLSLASGTGNIFLHGDVGSTTANERLSALTITNSGSGTFGIGGTIYLTAFSNLTHNSRPITVLSSLGTGGINSNNTAISFTQTIDAQTSGTGNFTLNAGTSTISLSGAIGGTTPLGPFTCTAATSIALPTSTKTAGGAIAMNGPVAMSAGVALDSTNGGLTAAGANIAITGAVTGAQALTMRAGSAGGITFGSSVGTTLSRVTTLTLTSGASLSLGGSLFLTNSVAIPMATTLTGNAEINTGP